MREEAETVTKAAAVAPANPTPHLSTRQLAALPAADHQAVQAVQADQATAAKVTQTMLGEPIT